MRTMIHRLSPRNRHNFSTSMHLSLIAISILSFGLLPYSFMSMLVFQGHSRYAGLTRRQMKDMFWLQYL